MAGDSSGEILSEEHALCMLGTRTHQGGLREGAAHLENTLFERSSLIRTFVYNGYSFQRLQDIKLRLWTWRARFLVELSALQRIVKTI
jgi:hypothetical protein